MILKLKIEKIFGLFPSLSKYWGKGSKYLVITNKIVNFAVAKVRRYSFLLLIC